MIKVRFGWDDPKLGYNSWDTVVNDYKDIVSYMHTHQGEYIEKYEEVDVIVCRECGKKVYRTEDFTSIDWDFYCNDCL